ncbi:gluconate 2-dehydrogenase subunit 3 family protein [Flavobacteriaceae bacterium 14752]|uniref:gluconate 2-dehydrogenase subunit 3 family protein n=1 Tax=Mesohalobacter salilacus TaxID=2491711 RepID=UPI000F634705|nr:gluconate 2-dehydrogenase subunit 3 family protein [Flavobacteriaceae bacterium 14752]
MNRRDVLKRIGIVSAAVIATPSVLSILNSCTTEPKLWTPKFLSIPEGQLLTKLVDVFLPKTELPSATELNVPEFIDRYINEIFLTKDQQRFKVAYENVLLKLENESKKEINDIEAKDIQLFLDEHLKVKDEVDIERENNLNLEGLTTSECLNALKDLCILAYLTTEKIGEEILAYDPVPGKYYCGDLQELTQGKSRSLDYSSFSHFNLE